MVGVFKFLCNSFVQNNFISMLLVLQGGDDGLLRFQRANFLWHKRENAGMKKPGLFVMPAKNNMNER